MLTEKKESERKLKRLRKLSNKILSLKIEGDESGEAICSLLIFSKSIINPNRDFVEFFFLN